VRRIAEHENALAGYGEPVPLQRALTGEAAKLVAVVMIIGKRAELEIMPHSVMRELELGAALEVPGEQAKEDVFAHAQGLQQRHDPGEQPP